MKKVLMSLILFLGISTLSALGNELIWDANGKPAEDNGFIICSGTIKLDNGIAGVGKVSAFAVSTDIEAKGRVLYEIGADKKFVGNKTYTFKAKIGNAGNKLPNDTYAVWISAELVTQGPGFLYYCPPMEPVTIVKGAGEHDPKGTLSLTVSVPKTIATMQAVGGFSTVEGWSMQKNPIRVYALPTTGGAISWKEPTVNPEAKTYVSTYTLLPGDYRIISIMQLEENGGTEKKQQVASEIRDYAATGKKE